MDRIDEQKAPSDVTGRDHKINKTGLNQDNHQHFACEKISKNLSGKSTCQGASLQYLYIDIHHVGNIHGELRDQCAAAGLRLHWDHGDLLGLFLGLGGCNRGIEAL